LTRSSRGARRDVSLPILKLLQVIIPSSSSQGAAQMDPTDTESMQHELQIMARLCHPNIVRVYGGCMRPPNLFVVEEIMASYIIL
jgi:serine/threonine protein kinase